MSQIIIGGHLVEEGDKIALSIGPEFIAVCRKCFAHVAARIVLCEGSVFAGTMGGKIEDAGFICDECSKIDSCQ